MLDQSKIPVIITHQARHFEVPKPCSEKPGRCASIASSALDPPLPSAIKYQSVRHYLESTIRRNSRQFLCETVPAAKRELNCSSIGVGNVRVLRPAENVVSTSVDTFADVFTIRRGNSAILTSASAAPPLHSNTPEFTKVWPVLKVICNWIPLRLRRHPRLNGDCWSCLIHTAN